MSKKEPIKKLAHYYICYSCAILKGAKADGRNHTIHKAKCPYCGDETMLNSIHDYHWSEEFETPHIFD